MVGNLDAFAIADELPLETFGQWLPACLDWNAGQDPDRFPTVTAAEVLSFLAPYHD
ncbi:hypothetical protein [Stenomitos frigidus]|uniref:hypothetical protein n=1 Tax=Stenomitos frigidus TaxID=1886765 RepID=UPI0015E6D219|nr:hypothetical protein [Stenomitos frigidus]